MVLVLRVKYILHALRSSNDKNAKKSRDLGLVKIEASCWGLEAGFASGNIKRAS
jgi:hypothetical protein